MLASVLTTYRFSLGLLQAHIADMSDEELARPITPGHHSGMWVLGHLVIAANIALKRIGQPHSLPEDRMNAFGPGSDPAAPLPPGLNKATLLAELLATPDAIERALALAGDAALDKPHGAAWLEGTPLKTIRDTVGQLLTYHAGYHIGQLSVYRRASGREALF
jgi:uncharacterized damage-inducible protein DinB